MFPDLTRDDVFRIETRRLWLRWPTDKDRAAILSLAGDPSVAAMLARVPNPLPAPVVDAFLLQSRAGNAAGTGLTLALALRAAPAKLIGIVSIDDGIGAVPELGYWLGQPYWGSGLMREAVSALCHAFFAYAGGEELAASARIVNPASRRVLEACGFQHSGTETRNFPARGEALPVDLFRLERRQWPMSVSAPAETPAMTEAMTRAAEAVRRGRRLPATADWMMVRVADPHPIRDSNREVPRRSQGLCPLR
ncbi:GNAT family N-acetyltransferase [Methylobacterium phyllosphaerae]